MRRAATKAAIVLVWAAFALMGAAASPAVSVAAPAAYRIVPDASHRLVRLGYDFRGAELVLFGAIAPPLPEGAKADVVIAITGPRRPAVLWRKRRLAGLWVDERVAQLPAAPSFHALLATRPVEEIAPPAVLAARHLLPGTLDLEAGAATAPSSGAQEEPLSQAVTEALKARGLVVVATGPQAVELREGALFRAELRLPANITEGPFSARILLLRDGEVVAEQTLPFAARKTGIEHLVAHAAHRAPFLYGLAAVFLSLFAGWLASLWSRRRFQ